MRVAEAPDSELGHRVLGHASPAAWARALVYLAPRAFPGVERVDGATWERRVHHAAGVGTVRVRRAASGAIVADVAGLSPADADEACGRVVRMFDLGADLHGVSARLRADPWLAGAVPAEGARPLLGAFEPFEAAVRAILGQQVTVARAWKLGETLWARCAAVAAPGAAVLSPANVVAADLDRLGMPGARVRALVAVAGAVLGEPALLAPVGDVDAVVARLVALPGVGPWTAHTIALRAIGHRDAFPAADVGLLRGVEALHGARPTPAELLARAEAWRPYRAYAASLLWAAG